MVVFRLNENAALKQGRSSPGERYLDLPVDRAAVIHIDGEIHTYPIDADHPLHNKW